MSRERGELGSHGSNKLGTGVYTLSKCEKD
jgi:hypothetical protein